MTSRPIEVPYLFDFDGIIVGDELEAFVPLADAFASVFYYSAKTRGHEVSQVAAFEGSRSPLAYLLSSLQVPHPFE